MNEKYNISEYIKIKRGAKELSQRQLAELCGISNTEIWQIESGKRKKVQPLILKAIAPHIGSSYEELMQIAGYISDNPVINISNMDEEKMPEYFIEALSFILKAYSDLSETEFKFMLQMSKNYHQTILESKNK